VVTSRLWEETERGYGAGVLFFWIKASVRLRELFTPSRSKIECKDQKLQGVLPVKGDFIEALWTEDGKVKGWFAAEVLLGDVSQRQAKKRSAASGI
jgi:hypothetical protein